MSAQQLMDWMAYASVEPFGSVFDDARSAQVVQTYANMHRDRKRHSQPFPLKRFMLMHHDDLTTSSKQTWQEKKQILTQMAMAFTPAANAKNRKKSTN